MERNAFDLRGMLNDAKDTVGEETLKMVREGRFLIIMCHVSVCAEIYSICDKLSED
jgi:hypothetical protein